MTASRRTGGTGGWDDLACRIWLPNEARPPRLHLLDLDNLHVGTTPDLEDIDRIRDLYEPFLGADDLGCVAANHAPRLVPGASSIRSFRIRRRWRPFTVRLAQGADGADLKLIEEARHHLGRHHLDERFGDVVIGSGDRIFSDLAWRFREAGLLVHVAVRNVAQLAGLLRDVAAKIPPDIDWVLRVDGHTDVRPISTPAFPSNWELSAARAVEVVKVLIQEGIPPNRLAAAGFGEYQPIESGSSEEAFRRNRRIEFLILEIDGVPVPRDRPPGVQ